MTLFIFLQAGGGGMASLIFPVAIIAVMWFTMLRPQWAAQKKVAEFQSKIASGMDVVTQSGLIGKVTKVDDKIITIQIDAQKDVRVRVSRSAITAEFSAAEKA